MNLNKSLNKANLAVTVLIVIGILAVTNFFSYQIFYRWDLTQNQDYSISRVSKRSAAELDDIVNIKVYFSRELPSQYIGLRQEVADILDEYGNYANGKIRVEFIDPADKPDLQRELQILGIPQLQFNVIEKDKFQVATGYLGLAVQRGDKTEAIPVIEDTGNLEYQVTLAIKKVTSDKITVVGMVSGNQTADQENEIGLAMEKLRQLYQVRPVDLNQPEQLADDITTLIIVGPKQEFSQAELETLDDFVVGGGSLLLLLDGVTVEQGLLASPNDVGLGPLLENYGIKLNQDLVLDVSSGVASFSQGFVTFSINYPFWPQIASQGFDQENAAVANLENVILPWASRLEILSDKIGGNSQVSHLIKTTNRSWLEQDNFNLDPQQQFSPGGTSGPFDLALAVYGNFTSLFGNETTAPGRLIVVGDSDFIHDNFLRNSPDNLVLFQNLVDSLSLDEDLINIRSKAISSRPLDELSETKKILVRYLNVFGLTVIVLGFGLLRYFIRRRAKAFDEL